MKRAPGEPATVGIRELKANLSTCLKQVRQGRELVVTDRGKAVAKIVPQPPAGDGDSQVARFDRLIAAGVLHGGGRRFQPRRPTIRPRWGNISDLISEGRD